MNDKPEIEVGKLPVITKFIYTLGVLPTSYLMSMTYQEQVTWLYNYLQTKVIPTIVLVVLRQNIVYSLNWEITWF